MLKRYICVSKQNHYKKDYHETYFPPLHGAAGTFVCIVFTHRQWRRSHCHLSHGNPAEITFHADGNNSFTVDTDGDWVVTAISDKVSLSEKMGTKGKTTVTILAMTGTTPQTVVIRTPSNPALIGKITIKPDDGSGGGGDDNGDNGDDPTPVPSVTLYYDNLDGDPTYTNWANNLPRGKTPQARVQTKSPTTRHTPNYATTTTAPQTSTPELQAIATSAYMSHRAALPTL